VTYVWKYFVLFHLASALTMVSVLATVPDPSGAVALVYPPFIAPEDAMLRAAAAGGQPIRSGNFDWIIVTIPETGDKELPARARAHGALAVLNPMIAGGCGFSKRAARPLKQ
jgi:hypothetical protein